EARGYSTEGLLLLRGTSAARPGEAGSDAEGVVELSLSRQASQETALGFPLLRRLRIAAAPALSGFLLDLNSTPLARGFEPDCVALPPLRIHPASGVFPSLVFETAIKAPDLATEVEVVDPVSKKPRSLGRIAIPLNPAGDPSLEFGPQF